eukprot:gene10298-13844_t
MGIFTPSDIIISLTLFVNAIAIISSKPTLSTQLNDQGSSAVEQNNGNNEHIPAMKIECESEKLLPEVEAKEEKHNNEEIVNNKNKGIMQSLRRQIGSKQLLQVSTFLNSAK